MSFCDRQAIPGTLVRSRNDDGTDCNQTGHNKTSEDEGGRGDSDVESVDSSKDVTYVRRYSFVSTTTNTSVFGMHRLLQHATRR